MLRRCVWVLLCCAASLTLCGCGASPASGGSQSPTRASAANLNGNWLLAGTIPQGPLSLVPGSSLSITFSATGNQLAGSGYLSVFCKTGNLGSGFGEGFVVSGTMNSDDTFTVQTPVFPSGFEGTTITITGSVPSAPNQAWTGQYALAIPQGNSCSSLTGGNFAASGLGAISGTFAGTGTIGLGANASPVSISLSVQQGSDAAATSGSSVQQNSALTGTIALTGHPCFHTGTITTPSALNIALPGNVEGDAVQANFKMDDGSTLVLLGYAADAAVTQLRVQSAVVLTGPCATTSATTLQMGTLLRQN